MAFVLPDRDLVTHSVPTCPEFDRMEPHEFLKYLRLKIEAAPPKADA